jgi:hypothetical protein
MANENNIPAFPVAISGDAKYTYLPHDGMTLLDYFAAKAMQGILASDGNCIDQDLSGNARSGNESSIGAVAYVSYNIAAAMLEERKKYINP